MAAIASGAYSGSYCTLDFLEITHLKAECQGNNQGVNRVCGHAFNVQLGNTISASTLCGMYKHKKGFFHEQQSLLESLNSIITTFFLCRLYCSIHSSIHNKCTCARYKSNCNWSTTERFVFCFFRAQLFLLLLLRQMANAKPLLMSWWRSAFNDVNYWALSIDCSNLHLI